MTGLLVELALGIVEADEAAHDSAHVGECIRCAREFDSLSDAAAALAWNLAPTSPSVDVRTRILDTVVSWGPALETPDEPTG